MKLKLTNPTKSFLAAGCVLVAGAGLLNTAHAQSADALIDKLVQKGILTVKEANDLREDSDKGFNQAYQAKTGMPDWVTSMKFSGDFRGRFEQNYTDNKANVFPTGPGTFGPAEDRGRWRYRVRFGVTASLVDDFEVGLRLASGNPFSSFGGNPVSANTDLSDGSSRKFIWVDAAYAKWTPIHTGPWLAGATLGKMDNPFQLSPMVFDPDIQLEGAAIQAASQTDKHGLKSNGGAFVLDEFNHPSTANPAASHDPYLFGAQLLLESKWTPKIETALGISAFSITSKENLGTGTAPNNNDGNTRDDLTGLLVNNYNPIVGSAAFTYKLTSFPLYTGEFPIKFAGEYMDNPGAAKQNVGYWAGVTLGKSGHKGTWDISYKWQRLEADAWYDEFPDDDFGAFYQQGSAGGGFISAANPKGAGFRGGTNVKGLMIKANFSFTDSMTLSVTYYLAELINPNPVGSISTSGHFMVDLMWKF